MPKLKARYDDIYVLRNDEQSTRFKLTEFGGVRGFMPDFIMILTRHSDNTYWQVFLEPKGMTGCWMTHGKSRCWKR